MKELLSLLYNTRQLLLALFVMVNGVSHAYDFQSSEGLFFDIISGTNEVFVHPGNGGLAKNYQGEITVPQIVLDGSGNAYTVVGIGDYAFTASRITSVSLPNTIRFIDDYAFSNCAFLNTIVLPNSLESIGQYAFLDCRSLSTIIIPELITTIGRSTFGGCSNLISVTLSSNLKEIGENAFSNCNKLSSIVFPNSINEIGKDAFRYCI